jgi:hypothetical protein
VWRQRQPHLVTAVTSQTSLFIITNLCERSKYA